MARKVTNQKKVIKMKKNMQKKNQNKKKIHMQVRGGGQVQAHAEKERKS